MITIEIPGEPVAQGRGRATGYQLPTGQIRTHVYDPAKSRSWKAAARWEMQRAMNGSRPIAGPVSLSVWAYFTCPRTDWRKRQPCGERWHAKRPDADNVVKAVKDAAKGVIWLDDAQVADMRVRKIIAAQGEAPRVVLQVNELEARGAAGSV